MPEPIEYEILYRGACGKLFSTGIIETNQRNELEYKNGGEYLKNTIVYIFLLSFIIF